MITTEILKILLAFSYFSTATEALPTPIFPLHVQPLGESCSQSTLNSPQSHMQRLCDDLHFFYFKFVSSFSASSEHAELALLSYDF